MKSPIQRPPIIDITSSLYCVNKCWYCPQKLLKESYKGDVFMLTLENFKKAMANVPPAVQVTFAGFSEPFQNPEAADMMVYAHETGHRVALYTTTVCMRDSDVEKIKDIPFVWVRVHDIGQPKKDLSFVDDWSPAPLPNNRANQLDTMPKTPEKKLGYCCQSRDFHFNVMMPNGDVFMCCSDWALKYKLGNLFETNYFDLNRNWDRELCKFCQYNVV